MRKIKILYAYLGFFRDAGGELHPLALAKELDRERFVFQVATICPTTSVMGAELKSTGCPVYELGFDEPRFRRPLALVMTVLAFYRLFRRIRPDIVQTQTWPCNLWARFAARCASVPIIITTINSIESAPGRISRPFYAALSNWLQRDTAATVFVSKHLVKRTSREFNQTPIEIIPPPLDLTRFLAGRERLPQVRPLSYPERPSLGIVARLSPEKGHAVAIAGMRRILEAKPNTRLIIVGSGPLESELRSQVQALGLTNQVEFTGYQSDVCGEMCRMDVLLVPSYFEGSPLAAFEAMALGLPVLASRIGALCEILEDGTYGSLTAPGDSEGLAQAVIDMLSDPEAVLRKARLAREHVLAQYGVTHFVNSHAELYERLVAAV